MTDTKLRPICYPSNEDKNLFDHLRDECTIMQVATKFAAMYETASEDIRKQYYIECDRPTPRGKAEALFRIIAYHLDMNVVDVRTLVFWNSPRSYINVLNFAAKLPCANRKAKDSENIDTTVHCLVSDAIDELLSMQDKVMNAIQADRVKHHEDEED